LTDEEYRDIPLEVSSQKKFHKFVTEFLLKPDKGDIVENFVKALRNEKEHPGHEDLLKQIERNEILKKVIGD